MADKPNVLRQTDDDARLLARNLVRAARYVALAVIDPTSGFPLASRALMGTDIDGAPVLLTSALSAHTAALIRDGRASILAGEPGKGDPLAHPRISVECQARRITAQEPAHSHIRRRFLARHPKAALYVDFPDFSFFRLTPLQASLNGGFGKAYALTGQDLLITSPACDAVAAMEESAVDHMNSDHGEAAPLYATKLARAPQAAWTICGIDAEGLDLTADDQLVRVNFAEPLASADDLRSTLSALLNQAREI